ncbi:MAG: GPP34 family phosphoprotein, partial [Actinomycetota bacterium]
MTTDQRLLAEDLLLLAWDPDAGKPRGSTAVQLPMALGGALLLDLALRDRLRIEVDVPRASGRPTGDELLDEVAAQLRDGSRRRKLKGWVRKVGTTARREQVR